MELKFIMPAITRKFHSNKSVSAIEAKRAGEIVKLLNDNIRMDNNSLTSKYSFLLGCYVKDGKIMCGKHEIKPAVYEKAIECMPNEVYQTYKTALRNNTTLSNGRIILESNKNFVEELNKARAKDSHVRFNYCYDINNAGQIADSIYKRSEMRPGQMHNFRQYDVAKSGEPYYWYRYPGKYVGYIGKNIETATRFPNNNL